MRTQVAEVRTRGAPLLDFVSWLRPSWLPAADEARWVGGLGSVAGVDGHLGGGRGGRRAHRLARGRSGGAVGVRIPLTLSRLKARLRGAPTLQWKQRVWGAGRCGLGRGGGGGAEAGEAVSPMVMPRVEDGEAQRLRARP